MNPHTIEELHNIGYFSGLDFHFARTVGRLAEERNPLVLLAAALVSRFTRQGHVCLDLGTVAGKSVTTDTGETMEGDGWPKMAEWSEVLSKSPLVARCDATAPLVMDESNRLYLARYWQYQQRLLEQLKERSRGRVKGVNRKLLIEGLGRLFPESGEPGANRQRLAAETSVLRHLTVVSGGPGTGKTYTVFKMLQLIVEQMLLSTKENPGILLAAPTGKAAVRLKESIVTAKARTLAGDNCVDHRVLEAIPEEAVTIHRLLGLGSPGNEKPRMLSADVVVVDEASMVDLPLMTKLMEAVPAHARLILLGDKDQLASVEAGAILGDICRGGEENKDEGIGRSIVQLTRSYRFDAAAGIGMLAAVIRNGDSLAAVDSLVNGALPGVTFISMKDEEQLPGVLAEVTRQGYLPYFLEEKASRKWERFNLFRIICAHRRGILGAEGVNTWVERFLLHEAGIKPGSEWYPGRPVMVEQNDYQLNLFNGDVGVVVPVGPSSEEIGVYFPGAGEAGRIMAPSRLPPHSTVYAMTVHKSQGSEFDDVVLVLPSQRSPVVTRELLYTAVTRARAGVTILGTERVIREAVETPVQRASGLSEQLSLYSH